MTGQEYKRDSSIWRESWPRIDQITEDVLGWRRLEMLTPPIGSDLVAVARALMIANPLAPRDAFHLAVALENGLRGFVTADPDFDNLRLPAGRDIAIVRF